MGSGFVKKFKEFKKRREQASLQSREIELQKLKRERQILEGKAKVEKARQKERMRIEEARQTLRKQKGGRLEKLERVGKGLQAGAGAFESIGGSLTGSTTKKTKKKKKREGMADPSFFGF